MASPPHLLRQRWHRTEAALARVSRNDAGALPVVHGCQGRACQRVKRALARVNGSCGSVLLRL
jgi:hypothetical protein